MKIRSLPVLAAACVALVSQATWATPVITVGAGPYLVGQPIQFTVSDSDVSNGVDSGGTGFYLADFTFTWDPTVLSITPPLLTLSTSLPQPLVLATNLVAPTQTDPGYFNVELIFDPQGFSANATVDLFTLYFEAIGTSAPAGTAISVVRTADGGAYGDGSTQFGRISSPAVEVIPEPASWALSALALVAAGGARRRGLRMSNG